MKDLYVVNCCRTDVNIFGGSIKDISVLVFISGKKGFTIELHYKS